MRPDEFSFDVVRAEWLFTLALGLGLGLVFAALVLACWRTPRWKILAPVLAVSGFALAAFTGTLAVDSSPWSQIDLRLKPYFSTVANTAAMVGALVLGAAITAGVALGIAWLARRSPRQAVLSAGGGIIVAAMLVAFTLQMVERAAGGPRHPSGTNTRETLGATLVYGRLEIPTGIDVAANGDILVVELAGDTLQVLRPGRDGTYGLLEEVPLGTSDGELAFHGSFHPDYPEQSFAYVVTQAHIGDERTLQVLRVSLGGAGVAEPVVTGLPTAQGSTTNHHGSGLAFCEGFLFVSTSDGDSLVGGAQKGGRRNAERARAQIPNSGIGQVMRWRLEGIELVPDGVFGVEYPSLAMGLRNPFGIGCDEVTGNPWVVDNGERGWDQLRLAEPGSNHGWPFSVFRDEVTPAWLDFEAARVAPTGVGARTGDPNILIISAFQSQALYEVTLDREGKGTESIRLLREVDGGAYAVTVGPDGCVYFTDVEAVWRLQEPGCD